MRNINYPPEKVYRPSKWKKPNYDHIILWMLNSNEMCKWADFCQNPIEIPPGTLSRHLESLKRKGFVEKFTRGHYRITPGGKMEFLELSGAKKKTRKLNYPPDVILKSGRNYSHWILWMVYNNNFCKRSDFLEDPLSINQSSLSKNLSILVEKGFVIKEEGKYIITRAGKSEYSQILRNYNLDRQTILEEEGKRIEDNTKKTIQFFEKFNISEKDIQFRFLSNILKLDYEKVKSVLAEEEEFHKILLYLSINHPDRYPNFISSEDFSKLYAIKKTTLDYYIDEISEGKIYPLRFFKLRQVTGEQFYFQTDGKLEKMLRVITENEITTVSYLNKLFSNQKPMKLPIDMNAIINDIVEKSCEFLFDKGLSSSLREFLPEYIKYLAYKIEIKKQLKDINDKLEGIIWKNISNVIQSDIIEDLEGQSEDQVKKMDGKIKSKPENLELYYKKVRILNYFNQYKEAINFLENMLVNFPDSEKDIKLLKAAVLRRTQNIESGLEIINSLIQKFPKDNDLICYKAYWMQYLDKKEESIELIKKLIKKEPNNGIYADTCGEILMYFEEYNEAAKWFIKAMVIGRDDWYIYQTYIKLGICYKALDKYELALKNLNDGRVLAEKSTFDPETKQKWLAIADLFSLKNQTPNDA